MLKNDINDSTNYMITSLLKRNVGIHSKQKGNVNVSKETKERISQMNIIQFPPHMYAV